MKKKIVECCDCGEPFEVLERAEGPFVCPECELEAEEAEQDA